MTALFWQTSLLLLAAYFVGAWTGCMVRRLFFAGRRVRTGSEAVLATPDSAAAPPAPVRRPDPEPVRPVVATAARSAELGPAELFARARDAGRPAAPPSEPAPAASPSLERAEPPPREPAPAPSFGSAATVGGVESVSARAPAAPQPVAEPVAAPSQGSASAVGGLESVAARAETPPQRREPELRPSAPIFPVATGSSGTSYVSAPMRPAPVSRPDDLTRIRAIDEAMQGRLNQLGITRFEQIAGWRPQDVRRIGEQLGFKGRIEQENWIEQAQDSREEWGDLVLRAQGAR